MAREIILDTETTGLKPEDGHRVIELCALEMQGGVLTGALFHHLLDPERGIPPETTAVHGLSDADVRGKPLFADIADAFLAFLGDSPFVAHNARFDLGFINAELRNIGRAEIPASRTIDTVEMAKARFPGARLSLDALCNRFGIDLSARTKHSALVDTRLLAQVYVELLGGKQRSLGLAAQDDTPEAAAAPVQRIYRAPRVFAPSALELEAHDAFVAKMKDPLWTRLA
jgi:DNA polymerase III subunit epsilon